MSGSVMTRIGRDADDCLVRVAVEMPLGHPRRPQSCLIVTALRQRLTLASEGIVSIRRHRCV